MEIPKIELMEHVVTCETAECENTNIDIVVLADATSPHVICGACNCEITKVKKA